MLTIQRCMPPSIYQPPRVPAHRPPPPLQTDMTFCWKHMPLKHHWPATTCDSEGKAKTSAQHIADLKVMVYSYAVFEKNRKCSEQRHSRTAGRFDCRVWRQETRTEITLLNINRKSRERLPDVTHQKYEQLETANIPAPFVTFNRISEHRVQQHKCKI
jgi:hypothetical protein